MLLLELLPDRLLGAAPWDDRDDEPEERVVARGGRDDEPEERVVARGGRDDEPEERVVARDGLDEEPEERVVTRDGGDDELEDREVTRGDGVRGVEAGSRSTRELRLDPDETVGRRESSPRALSRDVVRDFSAAGARRVRVSVRIRRGSRAGTWRVVGFSRTVELRPVSRVLLVLLVVREGTRPLSRLPVLTMREGVVPVVRLLTVRGLAATLGRLLTAPLPRAGSAGVAARPGVRAREPLARRELARPAVRCGALAAVTSFSRCLNEAVRAGAALWRPRIEVSLAWRASVRAFAKTVPSRRARTSSMFTRGGREA